MFIAPEAGFRGFVWEPSSEQDVVMLFGRLVERGDLSVAIDYSWTAFPDCIATDAEDGETVNIEFEFRSSSFWRHRAEWSQLMRANPSAYWWVVSWHDDLTEGQRRELDGLIIVALRARIRLHDQTHPEKAVLNWYEGKLDDAQQMFQWRSSGLGTELQDTLSRLQKFGRETVGFSLEWPTKPDLPWFTVRHDATGIECFKVYANGLIAFPFHRWGGMPDARKLEVLTALNRALSTDWFTGRERKKKGCHAAWLLRESAMVEPFLAVWQREDLIR